MMVNKNVFKTYSGALVPTRDVVNEAGGRACAFDPEHALAQIACTGCLAGTYYADDESQLEAAIGLATRVSTHFLAQVAVYSRREAFMKDMPALLMAVLSCRDTSLFARVFPKVIDNAKMVRTFTQIMRSGRVGRRSLGTRPKLMIENWFSAVDDAQLFRSAVGTTPSLADIIKMVHPKPTTESRRALYAYLIGRPHQLEHLPELVRAFESFKQNPEHETIPDVPFQLLSSLSLGLGAWTSIAKNASWQTTRMNLATFARHGVFEVAGMPELIAKRLSDPRTVARARVFPYQLMSAYLATRGQGLPRVIEEALHDALELATANVPRVGGKVWICPDVSGSMQSPVTGYRRGGATAMRCVDIAALVSASLVRANVEARVLPFDTQVREIDLDPNETVLANATKLAAIAGGGTAVSAPLAHLNRRKQDVDLVIYVSDNQSWVDRSRDSTATMREWTALRARCSRAKMICLDIQPYGHTQAPDRDDILNIGGFSDRVFEVIHRFASAADSASSHWVDVIRQVEVG